MDVFQGSSTDFIACIEIATGLPQYFTEEAIENLRRDIQDHRLILAIECDKILGFLTIYIKYPHVAEISWLAVRSEYQHRGCGTAMMNYAIGELRKTDVKILEVKTLSATVDYVPYESTRRFYERAGFLLTDVIDPYPGWEPGSPCAIYVKIL